MVFRPSKTEKPELSHSVQSSMSCIRKGLLNYCRTKKELNDFILSLNKQNFIKTTKPETKDFPNGI